MMDLLIEAARETEKLEELAREAKTLADQKVENALLLYQLVQIARGQAASVEESVRENLADLRQKVGKVREEQGRVRRRRARRLKRKESLRRSSATASNSSTSPSTPRSWE